MPMKYKIDVIAALKKAGYSSYSLIKDNHFSASTIQKFRKGQGVSWDNIEKLCKLLHCQPGDILEYED